MSFISNIGDWTKSIHKNFFPDGDEDTGSPDFTGPQDVDYTGGTPGYDYSNKTGLFGKQDGFGSGKGKLSQMFNKNPIKDETSVLTGDFNDASNPIATNPLHNNPDGTSGYDPDYFKNEYNDYSDNPSFLGAITGSNKTTSEIVAETEEQEQNAKDYEDSLKPNLMEGFGVKNALRNSMSEMNDAYDFTGKIYGDN
jgi:hypothetical protein